MTTEEWSEMQFSKAGFEFGGKDPCAMSWNCLNKLESSKLEIIQNSINRWMNKKLWYIINGMVLIKRNETDIGNSMINL